MLVEGTCRQGFAENFIGLPFFCRRRFRICFQRATATTERKPQVFSHFSDDAAEGSMQQFESKGGERNMLLVSKV
jgi:hypothetical protein